MSGAVLGATDCAMSLMTISNNLCNCTFIPPLFPSGLRTRRRPASCTLRHHAVCAALPISSLAPTQNNKRGGFVPLLLCGGFLVFLGVAHSTVWRKRGRRDAPESRGRREEGHSMVQGFFLKGILSPSRHLQPKEGTV